jgi:acyl-CoA oxidase
MYSSTHAAVFAQMHLPGSGGSSTGVFAFMVQLRDSNGRLMPGVEVGEIGPKLNSASTNIGYARFSRVRVPLTHLFSKNATVTAAGEWVLFMFALVIFMFTLRRGRPFSLLLYYSKRTSPRFL